MVRTEDRLTAKLLQPLCVRLFAGHGVGGTAAGLQAWTAGKGDKGCATTTGFVGRQVMRGAFKCPSTTVGTGSPGGLAVWSGQSDSARGAYEHLGRGWRMSPGQKNGQGSTGGHGRGAERGGGPRAEGKMWWFLRQGACKKGAIMQRCFGCFPRPPLQVVLDRARRRKRTATRPRSAGGARSGEDVKPETPSSFL